MKHKAIFGLLAVAMLLTLAVSIGSAQSYNVAYYFGTNPGDPLSPVMSGVIAQGRDGNLYSTTQKGGIVGYGAAFKITPTGTLTVLHSFDGVEAGLAESGLTLGNDGNFYGTTVGGGTSFSGVVFKISPTGTLKILHNFTGADGANPYCPPVLGLDGKLYGVTSNGGLHGWGSVYKITTGGTLTTIYNFNHSDGGTPVGPLVLGDDGAFYGTTRNGGTGGGYGTIFRITSTGVLTSLHSFDWNDGAYPASPLIQAQDGNFWGTTQLGGYSDPGAAGSIFSITKSGGFTSWFAFNDYNGAQPDGGVTQTPGGAFYGTTYGGGHADECGGQGPSGLIWTFTPSTGYAIVHCLIDQQSPEDGAGPQAPLLLHSSGLFFGDNSFGGLPQTSGGTFFSLGAGVAPGVNFVMSANKVGKTVGILGQGLKTTSAVAFNGVSASFHIVSDTYITAKVPTGASTGFVTVTTSDGTLSSNQQFRVVH
jgi:uncharacterized repeat protein (TIGR03803 family)